MRGPAAAVRFHSWSLAQPGPPVGIALCWCCRTDAASISCTSVAWRCTALPPRPAALSSCAARRCRLQWPLATRCSVRLCFGLAARIRGETAAATCDAQSHRTHNRRAAQQRGRGEEEETRDRLLQWRARRRALRCGALHTTVAWTQWPLTRRVAWRDAEWGQRIPFAHRSDSDNG